MPEDKGGCMEKGGGLVWKDMEPCKTQEMVVKLPQQTNMADKGWSLLETRER